MKRISLIYHEVMKNENINCLEDERLYNSKYTFDVTEFQTHMKEISNLLNASQNEITVHITFDDGRIGSYNYVADILEANGLKGYFFIITDRIGKPQYLDSDQIYKLHKRGHIIGTHTCSHPTRMSNLSWDLLIKEWGDSRRVLSDIVGEEVKVAAVPGGFYSKKVAEAAASVGIKELFTSEPVTKCYSVNDCLIIGRYSIEKSLSVQEITDLVNMNVYPRYKQLVLWEIKKYLKKYFKINIV
ncbi:polysaccharide deacetylase family protein [Paenibacillus hexagrammi]|uniref:Polysaccharide deacetylase family protein n=1 Tax=Paenibacillus hexagrammi TaxID=2908839 RepID=A0ABY3SM82_9BACL|nr:polysaccharide deacetylase family protein [Paenibacillus sp. YPD9-1]UJF34588.1 polysaccharide deacetylase family protein [Paenibacillus sp. YPD9-1]